MDINLTDHVVILDEAHNIEDAAREAGSCMVEDDHVIGTHPWIAPMAARGDRQGGSRRIG